MDVSCFLLVEDSGDSEQCHGMDTSSGVAVVDEDDAESCSCDTTSDEIRLDDFYDEVVQLDCDCEMWSLDDEALGYASADVEEGEVQGQRFGIGFCREIMDGMEDRVFWETCMAVGYP